jgi:hypothetical protein
MPHIDATAVPTITISHAAPIATGQAGCCNRIPARPGVEGTLNVLPSQCASRRHRMLPVVSVKRSLMKN